MIPRVPFSFLLVLCACGKKDAAPGAHGIEDHSRDTAIITDDDPDPPPGPSDDTGEPGPFDSDDTGGSDGPPSPPEDAVGNQVSTAASLTGVDSWSWTVPLAMDAIDYVADKDVYRVSLTLGDVVFLTATMEDGGSPVVIRLLDAEEREIGVSEEMPHGVWDGAPGVYYQSRFTGDVFIEVRDEGEWVASSPNFDPDFRYTLRGIRILDQDGEPSDTTTDADARLEDGTAGWRESLTAPDEQIEMLGVMQAPGDVDLWAWDAPSTGLLAWSLWPTAMSIIDPVIQLYDSSFIPVAWGDDGYWSGAGHWFDDVGILYPVEEGQRYYLSVESGAITSGTGTLYVGVQRLWSDVAVETEPNDAVSAPEWVSIPDSATHPGYGVTTLRGTLDTADPMDAFALSVEPGAYLSITVQALEIGSGLDARLTVYGDSEGLTVLSEATTHPDGSGDPAILDFVVPDTATDGLYIALEGELWTSETEGNQYVLGLQRHIIPLHD